LKQATVAVFFFRRHDDGGGDAVSGFEGEKLNASSGTTTLTDGFGIHANDLAVLADEDQLRFLGDLSDGDDPAGALVSFARSGVAAHWNASSYRSLLELAEACDVPVRWSCRTGVCHNCESGLVSGDVVYEPEPLDKPAAGNLLVCCSQPIRDVVIDL